MKTPDHNETLHRWLDGELNPAERTAFEAEMQRNPALREEADMMKRIGESMRASVPMEMSVPHADFFNSQIMDRITQMQQSEDRAKAKPGNAFAWLDWLRAPWALAGAVALIAVGVFLSQSIGGNSRTQVMSFYAPNPNVKAQSSYNTGAEATVLMLDGLDAFPADKSIAGFKVHHSENDAEMATTTLFDDKGGVLLVMASDSNNQPHLLVR